MLFDPDLILDGQIIVATSSAPSQFWLVPQQLYICFDKSWILTTAPHVLAVPIIPCISKSSNSSIF